MTMRKEVAKALWIALEPREGYVCEDEGKLYIESKFTLDELRALVKAWEDAEAKPSTDSD